MQRSAFLTARVDEADKRRAVELAESAGLSVSDLLRELVRNAEIKPVQTMKPVAQIEPRRRKTYAT